MAPILSCYYLDHPLSADERRFVEQTLLGPWARFKTAATALAEKRVPSVLPLPDSNGQFTESREQRAKRIHGNLLHAGIGHDVGRQVVWVMPQDSEWDAIFQYAIRIVTGVAPFVVQRWYPEHGKLVRGQVRVINTEWLIKGLE